MARSLLHTMPIVVGLLASPFGWALAAPPLPPLPGGGSSPAAAATDGDKAAPSASKGGTTDFEQLRRGIVQVEQAGRPVAVGMVLSKDGRILTSLSALGAADPEIRYADNTVVKTKVGHKDKAWDLALLIPQSGKWLDGLMPTDADPTGVELKAFLPKAGKLAGVGIGLKGRTDARGKEGDPLRSVLDFDLKGIPGIPGAPILDPNGKVVGMLVRACKESAAQAPDKTDKNPDKGGQGQPSSSDKPTPCSPITIGAPVPALRGFLMKTPSNAVQPAAWLGLGGAPTESGNVKGVRVVGVTPGSPAEKAGLKVAGDNPDTIVAVDGQPVETPEQLAELIARRAIGQTVKLLVFSQGKFREAPVTLRAAP
jgi:serine protease Do